MIIGGIITLLMVAALLITLLVAASTTWFTGRVPSGPDAMGLAGPLLAGALSWVLMLAAALVAAVGGRFTWVPGGAPFAASVAVVMIIGLALAALGGFLMWSEQKGPLAVPVGNIATFISPLAVQAMLVGLAWSDAAVAGSARWPWIIVAGLAPIAAAGLGLGLWGLSQHAKRRAGYIAEEIAEAQKRQDEFVRRAAMPRPAQIAEDLAALPPSCPLWAIAAMLNDEDDPECRRLICERARQVDDLDAQVCRAMASAHPSIRAGVLAFIEATPDRPAPWASGVRGALLALTRNITVLKSLRGEGEFARLDTDVERWTAATALFPGVRYDGELEGLRRAVKAAAGGAERNAALAAVGAAKGDQKQNRPRRG